MIPANPILQEIGPRDTAVPHPTRQGRDDLFGPEWAVCPFCGCGIHLEDLKPCPCGNADFAVVRLPEGAAGTGCAKVCEPCCVKARTFPRGGTVVGRLDADTGRFTAA
jgi:hypothetical protein